MFAQVIRGPFRRPHIASPRLRFAFSNSTRTHKKKLIVYTRYHKINFPRYVPSTLPVPIKFQRLSPYEINIPSKAAELPRWRRWPARISGIIIGGLALFWWTHREQVPISGRWRFNFLSSFVLKLEDRSYLSMIKEIEPAILPENHPITKLVRTVLDRLLPSSGLEHLDWKVHVVNAPDIVNASVSPSGKVIIYTGILPICKDESGIATVLSHEIGHVVASHSAEQASSLLFIGIASIPTWPIIGLAALGFIIEELAVICAIYLLPIVGAGAFFCRKRESEADYIGLVIMARVGYDIERSVGFRERMKEEGTKRLSEKNEKGELKYKTPPQLLSTHPHDADRIAQIKKWIPQIIKLTDAAFSVEY